MSESRGTHKVRPPRRHFLITQKVPCTTSETGIVQKDVDSPELGLYRVKRGLDGLFVGDFKSQRQHFDVRVGPFDIGFGLLQRLELAGCDDNASGTSECECLRETLDGAPSR